MKQTSTAKTLGSFEPVTFPDFANIGRITAKIDTGAYTGALHSTKIHEEETDSGKILRFSPFDHPETVITVTDFAVKYVRSSNGDTENRYFISTTITIQGETYPIVLSLADRSEMKWPLLIGRRFLRKNNFLVDVSKTA
ncbi:MAG TPA: RimK/LysX family protein [Candidatus Saccharimonadales bacterium]|nr:RimK/LysX family protein [Candidatus Saccharimonadales bacterium]